jgi:hypothetical protein
MGTGADGTGGNTTTYGWDGRNNALSQSSRSAPRPP